MCHWLFLFAQCHVPLRTTPCVLQGSDGAVNHETHAPSPPGQRAGSVSLTGQSKLCLLGL